MDEDKDEDGFCLYKYFISEKYERGSGGCLFLLLLEEMRQLEVTSTALNAICLLLFVFPLTGWVDGKL